MKHSKAILKATILLGVFTFTWLVSTHQQPAARTTALSVYHYADNWQASTPQKIISHEIISQKGDIQWEDVSFPAINYCASTKHLIIKNERLQTQEVNFQKFILFESDTSPPTVQYT